MKDTPGMIVDLRNNGGGSLAMSSTLISKFLSEPEKGARVLTRTGKPITVAFLPVIKLETELKGSKENAYAKPLVILTNENSASASEIFSSTLQDLGRASVIGRRTCGCLLGYLGYADLPGGGQLAYSEIGFVSPKGKRIEGEGVAPDIEIKLTREDILLNRDRTLEAAEALLKNKTKA
jgi:carboxyl-terminal processing protease